MHDILVVLYHDDGIAQVAQLLEDMDKTLSVARMETDGRLIEDIHTAHQRTAQRGGKVDALRLATAEGVAEATEREVAQTYVEQIFDTVLEFYQQSAHHLTFMVVEGGAVCPDLILYILQPHSKIGHRHGQQFCDGTTADLDVRGILAQAAATAVGAGGLTTVARHHDAVLYLIRLTVDPLEEAVDTFPRAATVP